MTVNEGDRRMDLAAQTEDLGDLSQQVTDAAQQRSGIIPRIWERDHTVWRDDPTEINNRLGWLDSPTGYGIDPDEVRRLAASVQADGIQRVVVIGMGGSSLFPEVIGDTFGAGDQPELVIADSTDPGFVRSVDDGAPLDKTLFVVSSKSGTTIETRSHLEYFWSRLVEDVDDPARHVVAVTDPGSELVRLGSDRGFRAVFENPEDIGGRFSALSYFGLVPAGLAGVEIDVLLDEAATMADVARDPDPDDNAAFRLGLVLGVAAQAGRDKLTVVLPEELRAFGAWIEQLVAESTGKDGTGIVPVVDEPLEAPSVYGDDRIFVVLGEVEGVGALVEAGHPVIQLPYRDRNQLGAEVFRWEFATAVAGAVLDVQPFDQPDVAAAKSATNRVLDDGLPELTPEDPTPLLDGLSPGDYVALTAFVDPNGDEVTTLEHLRTALRRRYGVPVTLGIGPRYLHSTGQLHKGGPSTVVVLQVVGANAEDVDVPGRPYTFGQLKDAQAAGDLLVLRERGIRSARVSLTQLAEAIG